VPLRRRRVRARPRGGDDVGGARAQRPCVSPVKQLVIAHAGQSLGAVSISAGIAAYPRDGRTPEDLFEAADEAVYAAKRGGRDRVEVAGSSPAPEEAGLRLNSVA